MGYIYLVTNKINGMQYVGQSQRTDIEDRWRDHKREKPAVGSYLCAAYKKYGINNFKFQIICICFDEDCDRFEEEYIKKFNTIRPNGYNLKSGGNNSKLSEETKQLISKRLKENMTDERRKKLSETHKGKKISEEHKKILSAKQKQFWQNMSPEEKQQRLEDRMNNPNYVNSCKKTLQKGADALKKRVGKFDQNGNLLESFESITDASNTTNISRVGISKVCLQKPHYYKAGGFIWRFI